MLPEELEAIFNAYAQMGQELPHTEDQARSLALSYRREKTFQRILTLTTDPDPDAQSEEEAQSILSAEVAAEAAENVINTDTDTVESEAATLKESATATPLPEGSTTETVE